MSKTTDASGFCGLHREQGSSPAAAVLKAIEINAKMVLHVLTTSPADPLQATIINALEAGWPALDLEPSKPPGAFRTGRGRPTFSGLRTRDSLGGNNVAFASEAFAAAPPGGVYRHEHQQQ